MDDSENVVKLVENLRQVLTLPAPLSCLLPVAAVMIYAVFS